MKKTVQTKITLVVAVIGATISFSTFCMEDRGSSSRQANPAMSRATRQRSDNPALTRSSAAAAMGGVVPAVISRALPISARASADDAMEDTLIRTRPIDSQVPGVLGRPADFSDQSTEDTLIRSRPVGSPVAKPAAATPAISILPAALTRSKPVAKPAAAATPAAQTLPAALTRAQK